MSNTRLMTLRAPVDGTVLQVAAHTVAGVKELLAVVPQEQLPVKATVLNKDVGLVRPGQPVTVKFDSFP